MIPKLLHISEDLYADINEWRRRQTPIPNMSQAIYELLGKALRAEGISKVKSKIEVEKNEPS